MNIDTTIALDDIQEPTKPRKPHRTVKYGLFSVVAHLALVGLLCSSLLFASDHVVTDEGDESIKAIMVDLSQIAAPQQSLAETAVNNVENQVAEQTPPEQPEIVPDPEPIPEPEVQKETKIEEVVKPVEKPTEKPAEKPIKEAAAKRPAKPKAQPNTQTQQVTSTPQIRQEVASNNIASTAVAPSIANNNNYTDSPSPISRNQPEYPRRALDMQIEGHVVVRYDVNSEGRVENIRFVESVPENVFNRSVITAMKSWKYKPVAAKDLTIKIIFNRNRSISLSNS